ncbi:MAG: DoxX family protein [Bacteroidota bacterium]|nr:DoxX family protein [Bacteroidota bacterium]
MTITNVTEKTNEQPRWLTIVRAALGLILIYKGVSFIRGTAVLKSMIQQTGVEMFSQNSDTLVFVITFFNLLGGLFIAVGLFTRTCSIVLIPLLIIADFFVNIKAVNNNIFELILSIIVLLLLVLFAVKGSGALSADEYFRSYYKAGQEDGNTKKFFR